MPLYNPLGGGLGVIIGQITTAGGQANVQFANIPQNYRDLMLQVRGTGYATGPSVELRARFNGDSTTNYDYTVNQTNGALATAFGASDVDSMLLGTVGGSGAVQGYRDIIRCEIANYTDSNRKACLGQCASQLGTWPGGISAPEYFYSQVLSQWWRGVVAVNQIDIFPASDGFVNGSVITLYGIS